MMTENGDDKEDDTNLCTQIPFPYPPLHPNPISAGD